MQFNSVEYGVFLLLVLAAYYGIARSYGAQRWTVVLASMAFYAFWSYGYLVHFLGVVAANYLASLWMQRVRRSGVRKTILVGAIALDLLNLVLFKYIALVYESASGIAGTLGLPIDGLSWPEVILPLGISFYTFHVISYLVDLDRGIVDSKPRDLVDFLFYVTMFPHQIAGPILRGHELFPHLAYKPFDHDHFRRGFERLLLGLFQKAAIADNLAIVVDHGYRNWAGMSAPELYVVLVAYSFQIFFDFAGYSNMGIGSALMLGYRLPENFDTPYIAKNISEFWRRWHMTLSRWIRDYIFVPLGGSRGGGLATDRNLLITMALAGLWHGAAWSFMVWGLYHGAALVIHRHYSGSRIQLVLMRNLAPLVYQALALFTTFQFVTLGWVLFRSPDFASAWGIYSRLAAGFVGLDEWRLDPALLFKSYGFTAMILYGLALLGMRVLHRRDWAITLRRRLVAYAVIAYLLLFLIPIHSDPFIYFQF